MLKTTSQRAFSGFINAARTAGRRRIRKRLRRSPGRRYARPLILSATLAVAAFLALDGPVFVADRASPEPSAAHAALEKRFATALGDTEVVIVDTRRVTGREAIEGYVARRLNARGVFVTAAWPSFIDRVSDPAYGARAIWRRFLGGSHGNGLFGYLAATGICVVTTGPDAEALAARTGGSRAFWSYLVLVHELQHCVDADRGNVADPGTMATAAPEEQPAKADGWAPPRISARELYADAATALFLMRDGVKPDDIELLARLRAQPVLAAVVANRHPVWTHFTAPMLLALVDDVRAGRLTPPGLDDDAIHAHALAYRDNALAAATGVSLNVSRPERFPTKANPATVLRRAGAPASWVTLAERLHAGRAQPGARSPLAAQ